jgi:hypothetical protein
MTADQTPGDLSQRYEEALLDARWHPRREEDRARVLAALRAVRDEEMEQLRAEIARLLVERGHLDEALDEQHVAKNRAYTRAEAAEERAVHLRAGLTEVRGRLKRANQRADRAEAAVALHRPRTGRPNSGCVQCGQVWPCGTSRMAEATDDPVPLSEILTLRSAVDRVRALHQPTEGNGYDCDADPTPGSYGAIAQVCTSCGTPGEYGVRWPCPTMAALDGEENRT